MSPLLEQLTNHIVLTSGESIASVLCKISAVHAFLRPVVCLKKRENGALALEFIDYTCTNACPIHLGHDLHGDGPWV